MKKYLLILFCSLAFGQASNQMVTFTQAQSLGFGLNAGQSHVTSIECMTKSNFCNKHNAKLFLFELDKKNKIIFINL
jgi:hypothetical protein